MEPLDPSRWTVRGFLAALRVPAIAVGLLIVPFTIYYVHVRSQGEYLAARNFRILAIMSDQIKAAVNNFQSVIKNAQEEVSVRHGRKITRDDKNTHQPEPVQPLGFGNFLEKANLTCTACETEAAISQIQATKSIGRLHIAVRRREGEAWLYLYNDDEAVKARIKLDAVVSPFLPTEGASVFEDVVIADQHDGRVLYEQSRSGLRLTEVAEFIGKEPAVKQGSTNPVSTTAATQTSTQDHEKQPVHIPSSVIETSIAGTTYKIFVQPLQLSLLRRQPVKVKDDKNDKSDKVEGGYQQESGDVYAEWLICGFVRSDRFFSEQLLISYSVIEWLALVLLLVFLSFPFLKLRYMTSRERVGPSDSVFLALSLLTAASVTTIFILTGYENWRLEEDQDDQLQEVAKGIQQDLKTELRLIRKQLCEFEKELPEELEPLHSPETNGYDRRVKLDKEGTPYGNYQNAFWADSKGQQVIKYTSKSDYTPLINIGETSVYQAFVDPTRRSDRWLLDRAVATKSCDDSNDPDIDGFLLFSATSPTTGRNIAAFLIKTGNKTVSNEYPYASITTQPLSLFQPVLPVGFGFGLFNRNGWTEFHSNNARNQRENLFEECENDSTVRSAAFGRKGIMTTANYLGHEHSMYLTPITSLARAPLSLVTFRDRIVTRTVSLEVLTIALGLFSIYVALLVTCIGLIWLRFRPRRLFDWVWPTMNHSKSYNRLSAFYLFIIVAATAWLWLNHKSPGVLIAGGCLLAALAVVATVLVLRVKRIPEHEDLVIKRYARSVLGLLVAAGVLPAILFWDAAHHFETSLFVKWGQRHLAEAFHKHPASYPKTCPPADASSVGAYHKYFYGTRARFEPRKARAEGASGPVPPNKPSIMDRALSALTVPYNQVAVEMRGLAGGNNTPTDPGSGHGSSSEFREYGFQECRNLVLTTEFPTLRRPGKTGDLVALFLTLIGLVLVCGAIYPLAKWSASEIFLLDQPRTLKLSEPTVPNENLQYVLALEPVGSSATEWIAQELSKETVQQPIKLQTMTDASEAVKMAGLRWRDQRKPIVIEDFEYRADDPKFNEEKLGLLEKLVFTGNCPILIISAVDPLFYLRSSDSGVDPGHLARWAGVLARFEKRQFPPGAFPEQSEKHSLIWSYCTDEEKLMLVRLAQGALVNPKGGATMRQLLWKGLIVDKPKPPRIEDQEFQKFVLSVQRPQDVLRWESAGGEGWSTIRGGFAMVLVGVGLILFVAQQDILKSWIPYATGLAGGLASIFKTIQGLRTGTSAGAKGGTSS